MTRTRAITQDSTSEDDLRHEHLALEARLQQLAKHLSLTPEEHYEVMVIKKRKLAIKDRLQRLATLAAPDPHDLATQGPAQAMSAAERLALVRQLLASPHDEASRATLAHQANLDLDTLERWQRLAIKAALEALARET